MEITFSNRKLERALATESARVRALGPERLRLVFEPTGQPPPQKPDGGLDWDAVTAITLLEVTDYHG